MDSKFYRKDVKTLFFFVEICVGSPHMSNESSETNLVASPVSAADRDVPLVGWAVQEVRNDVVAVGVHSTF